MSFARAAAYALRASWPRASLPPRRSDARALIKYARKAHAALVRWAWTSPHHRPARFVAAIWPFLGLLSVLAPMALVAVVAAGVRYAVRPVPQVSKEEWGFAFGALQVAFVTIHELGHVAAGRLVGRRCTGFTIGAGRVGVFIEPTTNCQQIAVSLGGPLCALLAEGLALHTMPIPTLLWASGLAAALLEGVHVLIGLAIRNADSHKLLVATYRTFRGHGREPFRR